MKYKFVINPKYESLKGFIQQIPQKFDFEGFLIYDGRNQVRVFHETGEKIVVKRFHKPYYHQRFDYTFMRPSKARRAYTYGLQLLEKNICTPEPIACVEEYKFGLFYRCYLVSTFCGDPDARVLREEPEGHDDLVDAIAHFLVDMHEKGFLHGDTNLSNFLYRKDEKTGGYHITTIDINRSRFVENPTQAECLRNLMRVTHVRLTMQKIVTRYAQLRGWNVEESLKVVLEKLDEFERKKEMYKAMKKKKR